MVAPKVEAKLTLEPRFVDMRSYHCTTTFGIHRSTREILGQSTHHGSSRQRAHSIWRVLEDPMINLRIIDLPNLVLYYSVSDNQVDDHVMICINSWLCSFTGMRGSRCDKAVKLNLLPVICVSVTGAMHMPHTTVKHNHGQLMIPEVGIDVQAWHVLRNTPPGCSAY